MVQLWEIRLSGGHDFTLLLKSLVEASSDKEELNGRLKTLFIEELKGLLDGEILHTWEKKLGDLLDEINKVVEGLTRRNKVKNYYEMLAKKNGLFKEKGLIDKRVEEFKIGINCLVDYLAEKRSEEQEESGEEVRVHRLWGEFNWERLASLHNDERVPMA